MAQKGTRTNLLPIALLLVGIAVIYEFDRVTHQDVIAALATIVICGAFVVRWIWRGRYS
jgi:uncharacterized membrane protein YozB (DUF420 family)